MAAWDLLLSDRLALVDRANEWLERLGAACSVDVKRFTDANASAEAIAVEHVDATLRRLQLETGAGSPVLPQEVGAGISQVLPVIVAAIADGAGMLMVEQPELHVHPALQVGLGDLFIEASKGRYGRAKRRRMLVVETHSEHLILRVLRRIRQTTEGELRPGDPEFSEENLSVIYVESTSDGVRIISLRVDKHGDFRDRWPKGFFGERMEELL